MTAPWVPPQSATACPQRKASPYSLQWAFLALTLSARWKPRSVVRLPPSWLHLIKVAHFCISCHQDCVSNSWYLTEDRRGCLNFINIDLWASTCAPPAKHIPANQTQVICCAQKCIYFFLPLQWLFINEEKVNCNSCSFIVLITILLEKVHKNVTSASSVSHKRAWLAYLLALQTANLIGPVSKSLKMSL